MDNTAIGAKTAITTKAGVYETSAINGIKVFMIITENAATVPAKPANVPTDGPLNKSLDIVWIFPIANWNPKSTTLTI